MSRYNRKTHPTRANIGGTETRMLNRLDLRPTARFALHEVNPPGSKEARKIKRRFLHGTLTVRQRILAHRNRGSVRMKTYFHAHRP